MIEQAFLSTLSTTHGLSALTCFGIRKMVRRLFTFFDLIVRRGHSIAVVVRQRRSFHKWVKHWSKYRGRGWWNREGYFREPSTAPIIAVVKCERTKFCVVKRDFNCRRKPWIPAVIADRLDKIIKTLRETRIKPSSSWIVILSTLVCLFWFDIWQSNALNVKLKYFTYSSYRCANNKINKSVIILLSLLFKFRWNVQIAFLRPVNREMAAVFFLCETWFIPLPRLPPSVYRYSHAESKIDKTHFTIYLFN